MAFEDRIDDYLGRIARALDTALPAATEPPQRLHRAMRYAVLGGGKRVRPLLVYATGETLRTDSSRLDPAAVAIELIHAFSLVHDDLPAMDDDDLRRGRPTVHVEFDEATAILAADALQPLAFQVLAEAGQQFGDGPEWLEAIRIVALACGSLGMTGGQAIDIQSEGASLSRAELERMHGMKTGSLIRASIESVCAVTPGCTTDQRRALRRFAGALGLAFQVRDDILDVEAETVVLGKSAGADRKLGKAAWPSQFGLDDAKQRCDELLQSGIDALTPFGDAARPLEWLAEFIIRRGH